MTEREWLTAEDPKPMVDWLGERFTDGGRYRWVWACRGSYLDKIGGGVWIDGEISNPAVPFWASDKQDVIPPQLRAHLLREVVGNPFRPVELPVCGRCDGDGKAHGADRPFESGPDSPYPGPCPVCKGVGWDAPYRTLAVLDLASHIRETRDWELFGPLWDLLAEAGCDSEEVEKHCRGLERCPKCLGEGKYYAGYPDDLYLCNQCKTTGWIPLRGPHVPGCWLLSLLLGED